MGLQSVSWGRTGDLSSRLGQAALRSSHSGVPGQLGPHASTIFSAALPTQVSAKAELPHIWVGGEWRAFLPRLTRQPAAFLPGCLPPRPQHRPACLMGPRGDPLACTYGHAPLPHEHECTWRRNGTPTRRHGSPPSPPLVAAPASLLPPLSSPVVTTGLCPWAENVSGS